MKRLSLCGVLALWAMCLMGQTGSISGVVLDAGDKLPLPGANVYMKDANTLGSVTDIDGVFKLVDIPVGDQVIVISFLSYGTVELKVVVSETQDTTYTIELAPAPVMGEEIVVTAQMLGQAKAINQQLKAESITSVVSADRIQEIPDVNAAEAISRLPGVSIQRSGGEGQKVIVRGAEPKFNAITVNGVRLPSNSGSDRSVDLSMIAPEILDGIEVFKSPLPDMDAEAVGGTVNLRLRKAPRITNIMIKGLGGFNALNNEFADYKGVLQFSKRFFNDKLGLVTQGSFERFNRSGEFTTKTWREGPTDSTGLTAIYGNTLRLENRQEIRKRWNASVGLDYSVGGSNFSFFGLFNQSNRDRFSMQESYEPSEPAIEFTSRENNSKISLASFMLTGDHEVGPGVLDWVLSTSDSRGETPYDFSMLHVNNRQVFDPSLDANADPATFYEAATVDLGETLLWSAGATITSTDERQNTAGLNYKIPLSIGEKIAGYIKFGGQYRTVNRSRDADRFAEDFYYLGGQITRDAIDAYSGDLKFLPANSELISILSFTQPNDLDFEFEGNDVGLKAQVDPSLMERWYNDQEAADLWNEDRFAIVERYEVDESVAAGYVMARFDFGERLMIIPGFRYEYSNNEYRSGVSSLNGRYGVNGFFFDTTTTQTYGEFLPHLHLKYQILPWLDVRGSYAATLARPDFTFITPRAQIDNNGLVITAGNPDLKHARADNFDISFSAFSDRLGLLSVGAFYKSIDDIFYPYRTNLFDQETADMAGWPNYVGYELRTYINSSNSNVRGLEVDLQTNLRFLPPPFNGITLNANYAYIDSETEVFFLTSETRLVIPVPPVFETTYTNETRKVTLPNQSPHIVNMSLGYDLGGFSFRFSAAFQGTKADRYSANKDFDTFTKSFWRFDSSIRQRIGTRWSVFLNLNNISNQKDVTFTRNENFINTTQIYGMTGTIGLQYRVR